MTCDKCLNVRETAHMLRFGRLPSRWFWIDVQVGVSSSFLNGPLRDNMRVVFRSLSLGLTKNGKVK